MYTIFLPEVAVNTETGKVTVEKFTCVADVGTIMNRLLVEGNFYGGLVQGIGLALTEDFEDLNHDTSLKNCGIPYPNDAPDDIELHFNETYRPVNAADATQRIYKSLPTDIPEARLMFVAEPNLAVILLLEIGREASVVTGFASPDKNIRPLQRLLYQRLLFPLQSPHI